MTVKFMYIIVLMICTKLSCCTTNQEGCDFVRPDFFSSMSEMGAYDKNRIFDTSAALSNPYVQKAKELYDVFWKNSMQVDQEIRIPKIIHQIWMGSPLPEKYKRLQQSWKQYHPDWAYMLWTEKEIAEFGLVNKELFDKAKNYGQKSDIARYEILFRIGGLYIDTDFECLKPFDLLHQKLEFYTSCIPERNGSMSLLNGLIASRPGHPILQTCIERLSAKKNSTSMNDIMASTGPYFFTQCVYDTLSIPCGKVVIFPSSFFYPFPDLLRFKDISLNEAIKRFVKDESFAIHWWHCSWQ